MIINPSLPNIHLIIDYMVYHDMATDLDRCLSVLNSIEPQTSDPNARRNAPVKSAKILLRLRLLIMERNLYQLTKNLSSLGHDTASNSENPEVMNNIDIDVLLDVLSKSTLNGIITDSENLINGLSKIENVSTSSVIDNVISLKNCLIDLKNELIAFMNSRDPYASARILRLYLLDCIPDVILIASCIRGVVLGEPLLDRPNLESLLKNKSITYPNRTREIEKVQEHARKNDNEGVREHQAQVPTRSNKEIENRSSLYKHPIRIPHNEQLEDIYDSSTIDTSESIQVQDLTVKANQGNRIPTSTLLTREANDFARYTSTIDRMRTHSRRLYELTPRIPENPTTNIDDSRPKETISKEITDTPRKRKRDDDLSTTVIYVQPKKRTRVFWSEEEENFLIREFKRYKHFTRIEWKAIARKGLEMNIFSTHRKNLTMAIRDKLRNLIQGQRICDLCYDRIELESPVHCTSKLCLATQDICKGSNGKRCPCKAVAHRDCVLRRDKHVDVGNFQCNHCLSSLK